MKINTALSPLDNVKALILESNPGMDLSSGKVTLGAAEAGSFTGGRNARILVTAVQDAGYSGQQYVNYYRLTLAEARLSASLQQLVQFGVTLAVVKTYLCNAFGLIESQITLSGSLPTSGGTSTVTLTAIAGSLIYIPGNTLSVTLISYATMTQFTFVAGVSANSGSTGLSSRGGRGYMHTRSGLTATTGTSTPTNVTAGSWYLTYAVSWNDGIEGDTPGFFPSQFSIGIGPASGSTICPQSHLKWLEVARDDLANKPIVLSQNAANASQFVAGINYQFPSRWDFPRNSMPRPAAGERYLVRLYHM